MKHKKKRNQKNPAQVDWNRCLGDLEKVYEALKPDLEARLDSLHLETSVLRGVMIETHPPHIHVHYTPNGVLQEGEIERRMPEITNIVRETASEYGLKFSKGCYVSEASGCKKYVVYSGDASFVLKPAYSDYETAKQD